MPIAKIRLPDGRVAKFNVPDGTTEEQVLAAARRRFSVGPTEPENPAQQDQPVQSDTLQVFNPLTLFKDDAKNFDTGIPVGENTANALAGAGKSFYDVGRRVGQLTGLVTEQDIDETKRLDAPLMDTKAGAAGNIAGNLALFAPTAFIPGANTATGAGLAGAAMGAMQTTGTDDSTLKNTALGGITGIGAQFGLNKTASYLSGRLARKTAKANARKIANSSHDALVSKAVDSGYALPPSTANPSKINRSLESLGGKVLTEQAASVKNQQVTNSLAKRALGLAEDVQLSDDVLNGLKTKAGGAYDELKKVGKFKSDKEFYDDIGQAAAGYREFIQEFPELASKEIDTLLSAYSKKEMASGALVEGVKKLRFDAGKNLRSLDPEKATVGRMQKNLASAIEDMMERNLQKAGRVDILNQFKEGRVLFAKAASVHEALDETGNVSAKALAKMLDKKKPLSGELELIGKIGSQFPKSVQDVKRSALPGSPLDWALSGSVSAMTGNPAFMAMLAARPLTRAAMLSKPYQKAMLKPSYELSSIGKVPEKLMNNEKAQALARLIALDSTSEN